MNSKYKLTKVNALVRNGDMLTKPNPDPRVLKQVHVPISIIKKIETAIAQKKTKIDYKSFNHFAIDALKAFVDSSTK